MSSKESSARPSDFVGSIKNAAMKVLEPPSSDKYRKVEHLILVVGGAAFTTYVLVRAVQAGPQAVLKSVVGSVISVASAVPGVRGAIDKQIEGSLKGVEHEVLGDGDDETAITIPTKSRSHDEVIKLTQKYGVSDSFQRGKSLGGIYYELQGDMSKTHAAMWAQFSKTNALFPALFRGVRRMESELLAMILSMLTGGSRMAPVLDSLPSTTTSGSQAATGGASSSSSSLSAGKGDAAKAKLVASAEDRERIEKEDRANRALPWVESNPVLPFAERQPSLHGEGLGELCGIVTSGGTESIALAIRAYQAQGEAERGIAREHANIVCSQSAHAALDKACHFYGIRLRKIPVDENMQLDPAKAEKLIDSNTLCIFGSAVSFPHGVADDIPALGRIAVKHGVGLHSDNCLGGVLLSAMRGAGIQVPQFDFAVPGVTTMSVDVHKYGLASKGASVVAFRTRNLRCHVFSAVTDWSGGFYTTPTAQGSRSGGAIAQAWGSLVRMGQEGYVSMARRVHALVTQLATEIPKIPGLKLLGRPDAAVVAFGSTGGFNIYAFATRLKEKHGFGLPTLQKPSGLHVCVTLRLEDCVEEMLGAMRECAAYCGEHPEEGAKGAAGVYGTTFALPDGEVEKTLKLYDEMILAVKPGSKHPLWRERK